MMKYTNTLTVLTLAALVSGCNMLSNDESVTTASESVAGANLTDGDLKAPSDYRQWPVFLADIDKVDAKQIRDMYINPIGHRTLEGEDFAHGTISVMEIWNPKQTSDGALMRNGEGKLIKEDLKLIFLMGKSKGAGELVSAELRNGDWVYAGYASDGVTPGGPDAAACRECHLSEADTDWVFHYDEYFSQRN